MDAGYDLDGETVCARIGDLRYPRNRNQSQQHNCQENFSAHLDFSSEAVYLGKRCHWLLALGCWLLGRAKSKSTPTTEAHHGGLAAHHGGLAARRHGVSRRQNRGKQSQKQNKSKTKSTQNQNLRTAENAEISPRREQWAVSNWQVAASAIGSWLLGRAKSKSTPTTEAHHGGLAAHHGGLAAHHGGLAARRHGVSRRKNG